MIYYQFFHFEHEYLDFQKKTPSIIILKVNNFNSKSHDDLFDHQHDIFLSPPPLQKPLLMRKMKNCITQKQTNQLKIHTIQLNKLLIRARDC